MLSTSRPIVVTPESGSRLSIQVRGHHLTVDQPLQDGGDDDGPMPIELLGAALGACVAHYVQQFLRARRHPVEGLRVEVMQHASANPSRIGDFMIRVVLPMRLPPAYSELIERVIASCPAYNTLTYGARIGMTVELAAGTVYA